MHHRRGPLRPEGVFVLRGFFFPGKYRNPHRAPLKFGRAAADIEGERIRRKG